jgi:hypothetical protein
METTYFSCTVGKKVLSVCGSHDLTATSGFLAYRFGRSTSQPEFVFPSTQGHPRNYFRFFRDSSSSAKSSSFQLTFNNESTTYVVFTEYAAFDWNGQGVLVKPNHDKPVQLLCKPHSVQDHLSELSHIGIPTTKWQDPDGNAR